MQDKRKNNSTECQSISKASNYRIDRNQTERLKPHCSLHTRKQNCWFRRSVCLWLFTCFSVKKKQEICECGRDDNRSYFDVWGI